MKIQTKTKEHLHSKNENVSARKQAKGITLIALVITIIVLLILAGVTIAMLTGQNGILTNATNANSSSVYYGAEEQVKLAYMSIRTQIMTEKVAKSTYDATSTSNPDNVTSLKNIVKNDLNAVDSATGLTNGFAVESGTYTGISANPAIKITYKNSKIYAGTISANKPSQNGQVEYYITLEAQSAGLVADGVTVSTVSDTGSGSGSGSGSGGSSSASTVVFKSGETTVTTPAVGNDVEIGAEKFKVIKITGNKVTAMPYYNLDLNSTPTKQITAANAGTGVGNAGTVAFAPGSSPTWGAGKNIDIDNTTTYPNNVKAPIASYETYLRDTLGATNVIAKIGRYYAVGTADATITEPEYIGNLSGLNPGGVGGFWLGSSRSNNASYVPYVITNGGIFNDNSFNTSGIYGVRPVIIISLS